MKFLDKMILVPAHEVAEWRTNSEAASSETKVKGVDVGTMTDNDFGGTKQKIKTKTVGTMTEESFYEESVPVIAILPPGMPKNQSKKRKLNVYEKEGETSKSHKKFQWKEI